MATASGNFYGEYSKQSRLRLYWEYTQDKEKNCDYFYLALYAQKPNGTGTHTSNYNNSVYWLTGFSVNKLINETGNYSWANNTELLIGETSFTNYHNDDGVSGDVPISGSWYTNLTSSSVVGTRMEVSGTVTSIPTIPRASGIKAADANIGSVATIFVDKKSDTFTHTVAYKIGDLSGYILADGSITDTATKITATTIPFTIPTSFYEQIPTKEGTVTLTCITYNGNTQIGEAKTGTFKVNTVESDCKPQITATLIDSNSTTVALTGDNKKIIKYKSTAKITPTATAKNSATISKITVNNVEVNGDYIAFANVQSETFIVEVTDSRGYTNTLELKPTIVVYIPLSATAKFDRVSATSSEVKVKYSGNYYNGSFGSVNNSLIINWAYKLKDDTKWTTGGIITPTIKGNTFSGEVSLGKTFDYKKAYDFILYVSDKLSAVSPQEPVKKGEPIYDYGVDAEGNNYFWVNGDVYAKGQNLADLINNKILEDNKKKYHVGKIIIDTANINPQTYLGFGTWTYWGSGRVPVGVDASQTEFATVEKTGGEKTHLLTAKESGLRNHTHAFSAIQRDTNATTLATGNYGYTSQSSNTSESGELNAQTAHNNLQPYITCYMWKRTA